MVPSILSTSKLWFICFCFWILILVSKFSIRQKQIVKTCGTLDEQSYSAVVPNLGSPDICGLQLQKILANIASGEGFYVF